MDHFVANRRAVLSAMLAAACVPVRARTAASKPAARLIDGVVWQPGVNSIAPTGKWDRLGARRLLVQWSIVDGVPLLPGTDLRAPPKLPDWPLIGRQPWASEVILGLAGLQDTNASRRTVAELARMSSKLVIAHGSSTSPIGRLKLNLTGWYFPVEVDPTWTNVRRLAPLLSELSQVAQRPLWISAFDNSNIGPTPFADWLAGWLPPRVGVFFQDGVGVYAREPYVAIEYDDALVQRLGRQRTRLIAEAFRASSPKTFQPASADALFAQLKTYQPRPVYLFEGPTYVSDQLVEELVARACAC